MKSKIGIILGLLVLVVILVLPCPQGMEESAKKTAAVALLMAIWWIMEAIPIAATALIPLVLFPILGITNPSEAASPYANHLIFLFMGGFLIALSMEKWGLHKRIALKIISIVGTSPNRIILGFMIASAFLSMWISNTATTVMMVPIGMAVIQHFKPAHLGENEKFSFGIALMLGLAYASSIGGIGTLIGTPPNLVLANTLEKMYGKTLGFMEWLIVGVPIVIVMLPLTWLWLTRVMFKCKCEDLAEEDGLIKEKIKELGRMSRGEIITLIVFVFTGLCWVFRGTKNIGSLVIPGLDKIIPGIADSTIAMFGALLLFLIPVKLSERKFVMDWEHAKKLPWGILLLFGGGLSLANGFQVSGLAGWLGSQVQLLSNTPEIVLLMIVVTLIVFLTEMTSNTATTAMVLPILGSIAVGLGKEPLILLAPAAIAASCAFMLPVATPPNAIIFGSGYITIPQMSKTGFGLNILSIIVITLITYFILIPFLL
ncbi:DASS family sodium-coupled anion symporter [bacterium]|nr:DASS family sodium-coupled anion symporter [bacterium]